MNPILLFDYMNFYDNFKKATSSEEKSCKYENIFLQLTVLVLNNNSCLRVRANNKDLEMHVCIIVIYSLNSQ